MDDTGSPQRQRRSVTPIFVTTEPTITPMPPLEVESGPHIGYRVLRTGLWIEWGAAIALTVVLLVFHIARANYAGALWRDEFGTVTIAENPSVFQGFSKQHDSAPILTAGLLHMWRWTGWGGSPMGLRCFGMLVGIGLIAALWHNSLRLGRHPPLLALSVLALHPVVIQWGDSLRAYGLATALALLGFGLMWEMVQQRRPKPRIVVMTTLVFILGVNCLYLNNLLVLAICTGAGIVTVIRRRWFTLGMVAASGMVTAISILVYLPMMAKLSEVHELSALPRALVHPWEKFIIALRVPGRATPVLWAIIAGLVVLGILFLLVRPLLFRRRFRDDETKEVISTQRDLAVYATTVLLVGSIGFYVYLRVVRFDANVWYFIPIMGFAAAWIDAIRVAFGQSARDHTARPGQLSLVPPGIALVATLAGAGCLIGWTLRPSWRQLHERQTNIDQVAAYLEEHASDGDVILVVPEHIHHVFHRYYKRNDPILTLPPEDDPRYQSEHAVKQAMMQTKPIEKTLDRITEALRNGHRVWAFEYVLFMPAGELPPVLGPPPDPQTGWAQNPYLNSWEMQAGYFLQTHAKLVDVISIKPDYPVNDKEFIQQIIVISGWTSPFE